MDLRRLREETRPEHEATEATMPLMASDLNLAVYTHTLELLLPILRSWEEWASASAPASVRPLLAARRRSQWIAEDLRSLGGAGTDAAAQPAPVDWSRVVSGARPAEDRPLNGDEFRAAFLGAMYVMEGSTLGGRFIARHVQQALSLEPGHGDAYFEGHGAATGAMWRETTAEIAAVPEQYSSLVIAAARRTFEAFGQALEGGKAPVAAAAP